ncbi:hypothetical protein Q4491_17930 [Photobacterium sp. 2_MG-2023]|uniref:hypothetical protein n=1 Tax=Photobacterium sp. 2_MG-2023 TaxID=3062663 RepID=UPI0026E2DEAC|nr:hypothetical protein [Photobacterium sp. 2_MG-2023]MDO6583225.1 hypothetical protein [Photobacterium sp. 2_MG-2023]
MAFESQLKESKASTRRGSKASVTMTHSYKQSTKSEEMSIRVSTPLMDKANIKHGDKVDILHDPNSRRWMIRVNEGDGFNVGGKPESPTGLIRYTLKGGHAKLSTDIAKMPIKRECIEESLEISDKQIIFSLDNNSEE